MRQLLVVTALGVFALAGCHKVKQEARATGAEIDVASVGPIVLKSGVLISKIKVTNRKDRFVQVMFDRCEVEDLQGERRHRKPAAASNATVAPGRSGEFSIVFGDPRNPLNGDTFRIWLWVQPTDGSGVIESVPPLVFGPGSFQKPAQGFRKNAPQTDMLPPPTEAPPTVNAPPPGTPTAPCVTCGEPRPKGTASCPHCGLP